MEAGNDPHSITEPHLDAKKLASLIKECPLIMEGDRIIYDSQWLSESIGLRFVVPHYTSHPARARLKTIAAEIKRSDLEQTRATTVWAPFFDDAIPLNVQGKQGPDYFLTVPGLIRARRGFKNYWGSNKVVIALACLPHTPSLYSKMGICYSLVWSSREMVGFIGYLDRIRSSNGQMPGYSALNTSS